MSNKTPILNTKQRKGSCPLRFSSSLQDFTKCPPIISLNLKTDHLIASGFILLINKKRTLLCVFVIIKLDCDVLVLSEENGNKCNLLSSRQKSIYSIHSPACHIISYTAVIIIGYCTSCPIIPHLIS